MATRIATAITWTAMAAATNAITATVATAATLNSTNHNRCLHSLYSHRIRHKKTVSIYHHNHHRNISYLRHLHPRRILRLCNRRKCR